LSEFIARYIHVPEDIKGNIQRQKDTHKTCQRPYCVENTGSLPNSEVKQRKARIVLGWVTAREVLRVLLAFYLMFFFIFFDEIYGQSATKYMSA
jgi:hypothetical protein